MDSDENSEEEDELFSSEDEEWSDDLFLSFLFVERDVCVFVSAADEEEEEEAEDSTIKLAST